MNKGVFLFILTLCSNAFSFSGSNHKSVTQNAIDFLTVNEGTAQKLLQDKLGDLTYDQIIVNYSTEPDGIALTNSEIQQNSSLTNYNFENSIETCLTGTVDMMFNFGGPFYLLPPSATISGKIAKATLKAYVEKAISKAIVGSQSSNLETLKKATQHTYVLNDELGKEFTNISVAPYSAQAEYNLAVSLWNTNREQSLRHLGRLLHYIQDISVPHHVGITINIPDICRSVVEYVRYGETDIEAGSYQNEYEGTIVHDYLTKYNSSCMNIYKTQITNNRLRFMDVDTEIKRFASEVYNSAQMGSVDGFSSNSLGKSSGLIDFWASLWNWLSNNPEKQQELTQEVVEAINEVVEALESSLRNEAADKLEAMIVEGLKENYKYKNVNDDMYGTAEILVPKAILGSAQLIDKFLRDVEYKETKITSIQMVQIPGNGIQKSFLTSSTEVTQGLYGITTGKYPSYFQTPKDLDLPVESITYFDAILFCNARSVLDGLQPVYTFDPPQSDDYTDNRCIMLHNLSFDLKKNGYRLPSSAEWEYAYMARSSTYYYWGDDSRVANNYCWSQDNSYGSTREVGKLQPNAWNIFDIAGNVEEMTCTYSNPIVPGYAGGCYLNSRSSSRLYHNSNQSYTPSDKYNWLGFRVVRKAPDLSPIINLLLD